jgi:hypothetical protein
LKEIVAAKIGGIITTDRRHIIAAVEMGQSVQFIERKHMEMMDALDLGIRWHNLAIAPTIFCIDDKGMPQKPPS